MDLVAVAMRVLAVNVGSSILKLSVSGDAHALLARDQLPAPGGRLDDEALADAVRSYGPIDAVGHRVVRSGSEFSDPVLVDKRCVFVWRRSSTSNRCGSAMSP